MNSSQTARLQQLIHRRDKVLAVLHPPTAAHARIMERAGCEALFVGTGGVVGAYTGLADVGTATLSECVEIAGWIADSVSIPVIMDGDTGHGGIMAVRRMVRECIRRGIASVRIDDQPIEGKRKTQDAGVEVVPLDLAIARYRAAIDMKNELGAALWDFMTAFQERGTAAWDDFAESRKDRPYPHPEMPPDGEGADKQRMLEERYLSDAALAKYRRS